MRFNCQSRALPIKPAPPVITYIRASVRHASPKPARAASGPPRRVILFSVRCFIPPSGHYGFCFVRAAQCHPLTVVEKGMFSRWTLTRGDFGAQQAKRARPVVRRVNVLRQLRGGRACAQAVAAPAACLSRSRRSRVTDQDSTATDNDSDFSSIILRNQLLSSSVAGVAVFIRTAHKFAYG